MTPEQIEAALRQMIERHELISITCSISKAFGVEWSAWRRGDITRQRKRFGDIVAAWGVDPAAQSEFLEYRLRAGA